MIIWNIVVWMLTGLVAAFISAFVHLVKAEISGYEAIEWWDKNTPPAFRTDRNKIAFIIGLMVWPVRLCQFINNIPYYYSQYGTK